MTWNEELYKRIPQKHCMICSDGWERPIELKEEWGNTVHNENREPAFWYEQIGLYCPNCGLRYKVLER